MKNICASLSGGTITLGSFIPLTRSLNITGSGADKLTVSGGGTARIFDYFGGATLNFNFSGLTLASGNGIGGSNQNQGGALEINGGATNATVVLTNALGNTRTTRTSSFGYYTIENVDAGEIYVFDVRSKSYQFVPQVVMVNDELRDLNFTAQ